jgi:hypothetical protein
MPRHLWVGALGLVLLAPTALYWVWIWVSDPVRPADARVAFERLATVPVNQVERQGAVDLTVTIRSDASWIRIIRNWGDPGYIVAAVSPGARHYMYCLQDIEVRVQARIGDKPANVESAEFAPYGYSETCRPAGLKFGAPPGAVVQIHIEATGHSRQPADLIVEPYWTMGTKDRLVGIYIAEDLHLQALANALGVAGIITISFAALLFLRRPVRPAR